MGTVRDGSKTAADAGCLFGMLCPERFWAFYPGYWLRDISQAKTPYEKLQDSVGIKPPKINRLKAV
jgi:hypothetical protein